MLPIYTVLIRRDAHTTTAVTVPEHEIAILQTIHGEEHVHNARHQSLKDTSLTDEDVAGEREFEGEFERLAAKYGANDDGLIVEQVFGKKAAKGLETAMAAAAKGKAKKGGAKAATQAAEGE